MNPGVIADIVSAVALIGGIVFAAVQLTHLRASREREAALELLHSFQTLEFSEALHIISNVPAGLGKRELEERVGENMGLIFALMATWESIGILVFRRELSFSLVSEFFSGPITVSWRVLQQYVHDERDQLQRGTAAEWFQWLAERIQERESSAAPVPAYEAHRDWRPRRR